LKDFLFYLLSGDFVEITKYCCDAPHCKKMAKGKRDICGT